MTKHKHKVSWVIFVLIGALTFASIANITQKTRHYHNGGSAMLIGIGFGLALAVTVYVVMIATKAQTRRVAIYMAAVFATVSAVIQTALYVDEGAPFLVAMAYGVGVPGFEAALAALEALLRREMAEESATVTDLKMALARTSRQTEVPPSATTQPPNESANVVLPATTKLTATQSAKIEKVAELAEAPGFATDAELAEVAGWSETTARRYRKLAEEVERIYPNGDGAYHVR